MSRRKFLEVAGHSIAGLACMGFFPEGKEDNKLAQIILYGPTDKPQVALTVDDCGNYENVKKILEICERHSNLHLTFFPVGCEVDKNQGLWRKVVGAGHEVGNHTYGHENVGWLPKEEVVGTIRRANEVIFRVTGIRPRFFRPPGMGGFEQIGEGYRQTELRRLIKGRCGIPYVALWSLDTYTGVILPMRGEEKKNREEDKEIVRRIVDYCSRANNGAIILMHDDKWDLEALELVIVSFKERGIKLVTLSELLGLTDFPQNNSRDFGIVGKLKESMLRTLGIDLSK